MTLDMQSPSGAHDAAPARQRDQLDAGFVECNGPTLASRARPVELRPGRRHRQRRLGRSGTGSGRRPVRYWYRGRPALNAGAVTVTLVAGQVRDGAGNTNPQTTASSNWIRNRRPVHSPTAPNALTSHDSGYVLVQWSDGGSAGLDDTSFGTADVTVSGVTIDRVENLGGGAIRYWYNQDSDKLADGPVVVQLVAGQVRDRAGNTNAQTTASFQLDTNRRPVHWPSPFPMR